MRKGKAKAGFWVLAMPLCVAQVQVQAQDAAQPVDPAIEQTSGPAAEPAAQPAGEAPAAATIAVEPLRTADAALAPAAVAGDEPQRLEDVIVTGELLTRSAERTAASVALHSGAQIERSTARDVYAVIAETPNASWHNSDLGYGSVTLRGIGSYGAGGAIQNIALYSTSTAIVVDGVALPRSAMAFSDLSAFDLDQVEIFRGPQSTSQGRNAMAGAVIVNTREPEAGHESVPEFRGRLGGGSDGAWQGAGVIGMTLWPQRLAVRVVTDHRATDGDLENVTFDQHDWARDDSDGTRLRMQFTPGGPDGAYSALLGAGSISRYTGSRYVEQAHEAEGVATSNEPSFIESESKLYSLDQRLRLGEAWKLRAVSAYVRSSTHMHIDTDYSAREDGYLEQQQQAHAFSQELRLGFDSGGWRGSFGAYYFDGHDGDRYAALTAVSAFVGALGVCKLPLVCGLPLGNIRSAGESPSDIEDMAVFGEVDWQATQRLVLTAGLRLDRERNSRVVTSEIAGDTLVASTVLAALRGVKIIGPDGTVPVSREFSAVLPKFAASYEVFEGWYAGAAYTEGYKPGGASYNYGSGRAYQFDSERTRNYELSFKGRYLPLRMQFALNLFHADWDDMQVTVGRSPDTYITNAGRSRVRGGELEAGFALADSLRLIAGAGITRGRFLDFVSTDGDYSGNPLPKAPEYSGSMALEWSPWSALLIRPDVQWTGPAAAQPDNGPLHQLESYALLNLALRWQMHGCGLYFNGSNLADRRYRTDADSYSVSRVPVAALGEGRRLMGGIEFQF